MPVIKSAIKKMHQARKKTERNRGVKRGVKELLDKYKKNPSVEAFSKLVSAIDKAAKVHVIHKNKAARLKSRLSKRLPKVEVKEKVVKQASVKKVATKKTSKAKK